MRRMPPWIDIAGNFVVVLALVVGALLWTRADKRTALTMARLQSSLDSARSSSQSTESDATMYQALALHSQIRPFTLLSGLTADGAPLSLDLGDLDGLTILYSIDPTCVACTANLPFVDTLDSIVSHTGGRGCSVNATGILVAPEHETGLLPEFRGIRLMVSASGAAWDALPLEQSPLLVLLRAPGSVIGSWRGVLSVSDQEDVLARSLAACREGDRSTDPSPPPP